MSKRCTAGDLAGRLGITRSQVFRELQALPHQRIAGEVRFSEEQVRDVERILSAGPDEELARLCLLDAKRAELRAQDDLDEESD